MSDLAAMKRELRALGRRIPRLEAGVEMAYARRLELIEALLAGGLTHAEIGSLAGVSESAITVTLWKARKRRGTQPKEKKRAAATNRGARGSP